MLNRNTLDELTLKEFNEILGKMTHELTEYDIGYLRARSDYLTEDELGKYEKILNQEPVEKSLDKMNLDELIVKAQEVGISSEVIEGKTKKELKALIEEQTK